MKSGHRKQGYLRSRDTAETTVQLCNACKRACRPQKASRRLSTAFVLSGPPARKWLACTRRCLAWEGTRIPVVLATTGRQLAKPGLQSNPPPPPAQAHSRRRAGRPPAASPCGAPGSARLLLGMRTSTPRPGAGARRSPRVRVRTAGSEPASL